MGRKKKSQLAGALPPTVIQVIASAPKDEMAVESPITPVQAITPRFDPIIYTANESDTYARIAAEFLPPGYTKHEYAVYLTQKNKNKPIRKGTVIEL
jgi:hypothetical protein